MPEVEIVLPRSREAGRVARRALQELKPALAQETADELALLVSELVTNAFLHGHGDIAMHVAIRPDRVRAEISDGGGGFQAALPRPEDAGEGGWGLFLVDELAEAWGVDDDTSRVWFELSRPAPPRAPLADRLVEELLAASPDPMWVYGPDGRFLYVSPAAAEMNGRPASEMVGRSWRELDMPAEIMEPFEGRLQRVAETGTPESGEAAARDGEHVLEYILTPVPADDGGVQAVLATARDVTARKRAAEQRERLLFDVSAARERLAILAAAGETLGSSLDYATTLRQVTELLVPTLADYCAVHVLDEDGTIRQLGLAHADPDKLSLVERLNELQPLVPHAETGVPAIIRTGESRRVSEITDDMLAAAANSDEHRQLLFQLGFRSYLGVPLVARGRSVGALSLITAESGRRYTEDDLRLAEDLAHRAALAVDNARLFEARSEVARTLQRALLPAALPEIDGVDTAAAYRAAGSGAIVGGDFYDVFELGGGEAVAVIGDVCGKGIHAAALTGLARHSIRTAAHQDPDPRHVLATVNGAIRAEHADDPTFCTVAYTHVTRTPDGLRVRLTRAGHPAPLLVRPDGTVTDVGEPGTLVGVFADLVVSVTELELQPGDALVLFTDGIVEARFDTEQFGEQRLRETVAKAAGLPAQATADTVQATVAAFNPGQPRDDKAVLVIRAT